MGVAATGVAALLSGASDRSAHPQADPQAAGPLLSAPHLLALVVGLALLVLAPQILRGIRAAVPIAVAVLCLLWFTGVGDPLAFAAMGLALVLALAIAIGWSAFPLGSRNRPQPALAAAAGGAWLLAYLAALADPLGSSRGRTIRHLVGHVLRVSFTRGHVSTAWILIVEVLIGSAAAISMLALRSLLRPAPERRGHVESEYRAARAAVDRYGEDSLAAFILRPDKSFHFHGEGVLAYRLVGETAVISGDPVAPEGQAGEVLASFRALARRRGWQLAIWGASGRHLEEYRRLGLRALVAGEEAFVDPRGFTLEGRRVRKLRQSVHRVGRRGWRISVIEVRELDEALLSELEALETAWRQARRRVIGFAMGMGAFDPDLRPDDLFALARSPEGELRAAMRFVTHRGKLSLDSMRRIGETPNGLNEALISRVLELARERGVPEVSLNYAGLAHLARRSGESAPGRELRNRLILRLLGGRFQLDRLVRFSEKFSPEWRPRYLVYESRASLPRAVVRVLQVEGYLPQRRRPRPRRPGRVRVLPGAVRADAAR